MRRAERILAYTRLRAGLVAAFVLWSWAWFVAPLPASDPAQPAEPHEALAAVATESILAITTVGRKSGQPRTKPIWFVYAQGRLYIQSGKDGKTHWYRNLQKTPELRLTIGTLSLTGRARFVTDGQETASVHALFRSKYAFARVAGLVGASIGHGKVVEVEGLRYDAND